MGPSGDGNEGCCILDSTGIVVIIASLEALGFGEERSLSPQVLGGFGRAFDCSRRQPRGAVLAEGTSVNHAVSIRTYFQKWVTYCVILAKKYEQKRTFAHCTYPVRMYVVVRIVSICKYLQYLNICL
jgi:hypothetical protein